VDGSNQSISETPSWALSPSHGPLPAAFLRAHGPHPWKAFSTSPRFIADHKTLVLRGRHVDHVIMSTTLNFYSVSLSMGIEDEYWVQGLSQNLKSFAAILAYLGPTISNTASLCCAIVASPWWQSPKEPYSVPQIIAYHFWCCFRRFTNDLRASAVSNSINMSSSLRECDSIIVDLASQVGDMIDLENFEVDQDLTVDENRACQEIITRFTLHGRSFCVTKDGRVCNAMNQARQGDVVTAFQGSDKLWILRPVGERYQLIGDAYVDGLMSGEAYEGVDPNEADYDIELV
jgi:hypothetical protein